MEIYITRHTKVLLEKNICYGQTNVPLNQTTFKQDAKTIKNKLPTDINKVYSSSLERCKALTEELNFKNIELDNSLMEMSFGDWEGKEWNAINKTELDLWMQDFVNVRPNGGENLLDLFKRASIFIEKLRASSDKKVLIVTHAGVIRCFYAYWLMFPLENIFKISVEYNQVFVFSLKDNKQADSIKGML